MIPSEFIYDNIIVDLDLSCPVYLGPSAAPNSSYITLLDIGNAANPAYLRDVYTVDFIGRYEKSEYALGWSDFQTIKNALLGHPNIIDEDGNDWCRFIMTRGPQYVNTDEMGRTLITMIFEFVVDGSQDMSYRKTIQ